MNPERRTQLDATWASDMCPKCKEDNEDSYQLCRKCQREFDKQFDGTIKGTASMGVEPPIGSPTSAKPPANFEE